MPNGRHSAFIHVFGVTIVSGALLGIGIESAGIASPFSDPVGQVRAQDESSYAGSAVRLAAGGGWLTPKVLGRYFLYKPPLLVWLAGLCLKLFGISLWALRLPSLAGAVVATVAVFWWTLRERSIVAAWSAAILLLSNPLWHVFARLCCTDMLLAASVTGALVCLCRDRTLASRRGVWGFAACTAAGVMAKNVAGVLPVLVLLLYRLLAPRNERPPLSRIAVASAIAAALIAPWHLYQIMAHPSWFWTDYVQVQLLRYGLGPASQISADGPVWYYSRRLVHIDPMLLLVTALALPSLLLAARRPNTDPAARLLGVWLAVSVGALLAFRFHNLPYVLYILPLCAVVAAAYGPISAQRRATLGLAVLCLAFAVKSLFPAHMWGLPFGHAEPFPAATALRSYVNLGRTNDLILVDADDYFYASALPLPSVRYYFFDPGGMIPRLLPHYRYLGIIVTLDEFEHLGQVRLMYAARLRDWGLDSADPVATSIVSTSRDGILRLIRACPRADFYLPAQDLPLVEPFVEATHRKTSLSNGRAFLLALDSERGPPPAQKWRLPAGW